MDNYGEFGDCSEETGWLSALKGQDRTAQGIALGTLMNPVIPSPERAKQSAMSPWLTILFRPFRAGTLGGGIGPQGDALGYPIPPLQGGHPPGKPAIHSFDLTYSKIVESLPPQFKSIVANPRESVPRAKESGDPVIRESATPEFSLSEQELITKLWIVHVTELLGIENPLKRSFYDAECHCGKWAVRKRIGQRVARVNEEHTNKELRA